MSIESDVPIEQVPDIAKNSRPWAQTVDVGPPQNVADDECGTANSLVEPGQLGPYTVNEWRTFFKPTEEQMVALASGGFIAVVTLSGQLVPHHVEIWPSGSNTKPAATPVKVALHYTDNSRDESFHWEGKEEGQMPTVENLGMPQRAVQLAERIEVVMSDGTIINIKNRSGNNAPSS